MKRIKFHSISLLILFLSGANAANAMPSYAVSDVAFDFYPAYTRLTDSGNVNFDAYDKGVLNRYEWTPTGGLQLLGPWVNAAAAETRGVKATGYNDVGSWVGFGDSAGMLVGGSDGKVSSVPKPDGGNGYMYANYINEQNMVAGYAHVYSSGYYSQDPQSRIGNLAFVWTPNGGTKTIPSLSEIYNLHTTCNSCNYFAEQYDSRAYGVNIHGQVVGVDKKADYATSYAFIWSEEAGIRSMGRLGDRVASIATDINNSGVAVGYAMSSQSGAPVKAFVWSEAEGMVQLDQLYSGANARDLNVAMQINERGQILVKSDAVVNGVRGYKMFLLTPVPEPSTQGLMVLGLGCLSAMSIYLKRR